MTTLSQIFTKSFACFMQISCSWICWKRHCVCKNRCLFIWHCAYTTNFRTQAVDSMREGHHSLRQWVCSLGFRYLGSQLNAIPSKDLASLGNFHFKIWVQFNGKLIFRIFRQFHSLKGLHCMSSLILALVTLTTHMKCTTWLEQHSCVCRTTLNCAHQWER